MSSVAIAWQVKLSCLYSFCFIVDFCLMSRSQQAGEVQGRFTSAGVCAFWAAGADWQRQRIDHRDVPFDFHLHSPSRRNHQEDQDRISFHYTTLCLCCCMYELGGCNPVHLHIVFVLLYVLWVCRSVSVLSCVYVSFTYVLRVVIYMSLWDVTYK